jgi:PAS domain S-box-containing protein
MIQSRIMIVEDEMIICRDLASVVEKCGHQVVGEAASGEDAITLAEKAVPDIVLMDIVLAGEMDGIEAYSQISTRVDASVVYVSARSDDETFQRAVNTCPAGFLTKPIFERELQRTIQMVMQKRTAERQLRESEARFKEFAEVLPQFVFEIDTQGRFTFLNRSGLKAGGYIKEDLNTGVYVWDLLLPEDHDRMAHLIELVCSGHKALGEEFSVRIDDGSRIPVAVYAVPVVRDGVITGAGGIGIDMSEVRKPADALRESEARLNMALEGTNLGFWDWNLETGEALCHPRLLKIAGYEPEEVRPGLKAWKALVHPEDWPTLSRKFNRNYRGADLQFEHEYRIHTKSGDLKWLHAKGRVVERDDDRRGIRMVGTAQDVTERKIAEIGLREERRRLHRILEDLPAYVCVTGTDYRIKFSNAAFKKYFGDPNGDFCYKVLRNSDKPCPNCETEEVFRTQESRQGEWSSPDNKSYLIHARYFDDWEGSPVVLKIGFDVTDLKAAQEALRQSEFKYRQLIENADELIYATDLKGIITYVNPVASALSGYMTEEILGKSCFDFFPKTVRTSAKQFYENQLNNRVEETYYEIPVVTKAGEHMWLGQNTKLVTEDGEPVGFQVIARDVTDRKKVEQDKSRTEARFKMLVESMNDGFVVVDKDFCIVYANDTYSKMTGCSSDELIGRHINEFHDEKSKQTVNDQHEKRKRGESVPYEINLVAKDGKVTPILVSSRPVFDADGNFKGAYGTLVDISERKHTENLLIQAERLRAVGELAGGVAHNFNNMLQIVMGNAQLAASNCEVGDIGELRVNLDQIEKVSRVAAETVKRLQYFAGTRNTGSSAKIFDVTTTVQQAVDMCQIWWKTTPEKEGIHIEVATSFEEECLVEGHENEIFEVVLNLVKNAVEALPDGGRIDISVSPDNDRVKLEIADTGIGMTEAERKRIFEPFFTTKGYKSAGMGLASCHGIVQAHGGVIEAHNRTDTGTIVTVSLPSARSSRLTSESSPGPAFQESLSFLLVDDLYVIPELLKSGLTQAGHRARTASSGREALRMFSDQPADVVICDLGMPEMNGWEIGKAIKEECARTGAKKPVFLMLTGWGSQTGEEHKMAECGVDSVMEKPADIEKILLTARKLRGTVNGRRTNEQIKSASRTDNSSSTSGSNNGPRTHRSQ